VTDLLRFLAIVGGAALVLLILADAIATLIVTRARTARWRPTRLWYATTWRGTRIAAAHLPSRGGDFVLNVYPALSLLGLLLLWLVGLVVGWACVYWGLAERVAGQGDWVSLAYYSGTSLLTPAFGVASGEGVRFLSLVETLSGLGTIALLISYLPALYGAYSRREARLLTLDDPIGGRLTPTRVIAVHVSDQNLDLFNRFCADWEIWTAEVLESHSSYPMLALFRSQHPGQSWITALGVVTDAATLACACIVGAEVREPYFLYRRGRRAVVDIAAALNIPEAPADLTSLTRENIEFAWEGLRQLGLDLRDMDETQRRLQELREPYGNRLQQLIDYTLAPHGFWGHSAEATVVEEVARATAEARLRARRGRNRASLPG
jgi:cbb3-type cytochrome oxidase subunit 3